MPQYSYRRSSGTHPTPVLPRIHRRLSGRTSQEHQTLRVKYLDQRRVDHPHWRRGPRVPKYVWHSRPVGPQQPPRRPLGNAQRSNHSTTHFTRGADLSAAASTNMDDEIHFAVNTNAQSEQPRGIVIVHRTTDADAAHHHPHRRHPHPHPRRDRRCRQRISRHIQGSHDRQQPPTPTRRTYSHTDPDRQLDIRRNLDRSQRRSCTNHRSDLSGLPRQRLGCV